MPPVNHDPASKPHRPAEVAKRVALPVPVEPQTVNVTTIPAGAIATLDGQPDTACTTPCLLDAWPGRHTVSITMAGHQTERRDVNVASAPVELPAVTMHTNGGTLMISSIPPGAAILVNGQKMSQLTNSQISLPAGTYNITVEKDGRQSTRQVQVGNGISYLKVELP